MTIDESFHGAGREFRRGVSPRGVFWSGVLVLFALLDLRTFVLGGAGLPAFLNFPSLGWTPLEFVVQFCYLILLLSFIVSASALLARSRFAVVLAMGQFPWRLICSHRTLEGLGLEALLVSGFEGPWAEFLTYIGIEVLRLTLTILAIRHFNRGQSATLRPRLVSRRALVSAAAVLALLVVFEQLNRAHYGIVRWRLDDGSLLWVTPVDKESYWLGRACGVNRSLHRRWVPGMLTEAECSQDSLGSYWVLAKAGEEREKYPGYFNTRRQEYGPAQRWEGDIPEGRYVKPARSTLLPF